MLDTSSPWYISDLILHEDLNIEPVVSLILIHYKIFHSKILIKVYNYYHICKITKIFFFINLTLRHWSGKLSNDRILLSSFARQTEGDFNLEDHDTNVFKESKTIGKN